MSKCLEEEKDSRQTHFTVVNLLAWVYYQLISHLPVMFFIYLFIYLFFVLSMIG